jgi:DNA polymerase III delta prime subunit
MQGTILCTMTSFLLVGSDEQQLSEQITSLCAKWQVSAIDTVLIDPSTDGERADKKTTSIGIKEIRQLQKSIYLKPLQSTHKAVILKHAELLTHEAQNALLKTLEEPPDNTLIMLCTYSEDILLPTIQSRCTILRLKNAIREVAMPENDLQKITDTLEDLKKTSIGTKLKYAELLAKQKEATLQWLEKSLIVLRERMLKANGSNAQDVKLLQLLHACHIELKTTNVNTRMALEHYFLQINL